MAHTQIEGQSVKTLAFSRIWGIRYLNSPLACLWFAYEGCLNEKVRYLWRI
jgi:hypothetical protein